MIQTISIILCSIVGGICGALFIGGFGTHPITLTILGARQASLPDRLLCDGDVSRNSGAYTVAVDLRPRH